MIQLFVRVDCRDTCPDGRSECLGNRGIYLGLCVSLRSHRELPMLKQERRTGITDDDPGT